MPGSGRSCSLPTASWEYACAGLWYVSAVATEESHLTPRWPRLRLKWLAFPSGSVVSPFGGGDFSPLKAPIGTARMNVRRFMTSPRSK